ncbi:tigger transposable element-derived protein 1-like [Macrobrachium rosenbergii]|uniref:tigger transposable element-derived protein 1-like n=1 Tax=Macrobrachium rosenbergii TaxID=79674 RepID=UPI0034D51151
MVVGPTIKNYLTTNNLPQKALLVLDNAPAHPPTLTDNTYKELKFIEVLFLPPNTTSILQPMDQQVVSCFKKFFPNHLFKLCFEVMEATNFTLRKFWKDHYNIVTCLKIMAWQGVTRRTLNSAWKKLWPEVVCERDFEGFEPEELVVENIVPLRKSKGLEVDEENIDDLVEEHNEELSPEELKELQQQQRTEALGVLEGEEEEEEEEEQQPVLEEVATSEIKEVLGM